MPGEPTYVELGVPDVAAAKAFYGGLLGWQPSARGQVDTASLPIGFHGSDPNAHFEVFFRVADLDVASKRVVELGGRIVRERHDAPGFGAYVECADDQGVRFGLHQRPA